MDDVKARAAAEFLVAEREFQRAQAVGAPEIYALARERLRAAEQAVEALLLCEKVSAELLVESLAPELKQ